MLGRLYLITDRRATGGRDLADAVHAALRALPPGGALVQLREKDLDARRLLDLARRLRAITAARSCPLLINDRVDIALAADADGVHLPESGIDIATARALLGPDRLIGASTHDPEAAARAARAGADLVVCGPIWATPSKAAYGPPLGLAALADAARAVARAADPQRPCRLFALGGIDTPARARQARAAGAHGMAAIRGFLTAPDPGAAARALHEAVVAPP